MTSPFTIRAGSANALACVLALATGSGAAAMTPSETYSSFWILGDSLSDNGNLFAATSAPGSPVEPMPASPPYFNGRFSSGPVWNEGLIEAFGAAGKPAGNFAFGGANAETDLTDLVPDLGEQIGLFQGASAGVLGPRPLVSFWFGANDLFDALVPGVSTAEAEATGRAAADAVADAMLALSAGGIGDFVVFNLPDLALTPSYNLFLMDLADEAGAGSDAFNDRLADRLPGLSAAADVTVIDTANLFAQLIASPGDFGVSDAVVPCLFPSADAAMIFGEDQVCDLVTEAPERAFFDGVHPNGQIHSELGGIVTAALTEPDVPQGGVDVPLPPTAFLLLGAIGVLGVVRR